MIIVLVDVQVKAADVPAFITATAENARNSLREPGVARFDVIQRMEDPAHFMLYEVYRSEDAIAAHKATAHYAIWRDTVAPMMAQPRTSVKLSNVFPSDFNW